MVSATVSAQASDEELMSAVASGDSTEALEILIRRHQPRLCGYLHYMTGERRSADEIVQDVFVAIWCKRHTWRSGGRFAPWMFAIASNRVRELYRRTHKENRLKDEYFDRGLEPAAELSRLEERADVAAALHRLSPIRRAVVLLRIWQDLPFNTIADILGVTASTARWHMREALGELRGRLAEKRA